MSEVAMFSGNVGASDAQDFAYPAQCPDLVWTEGADQCGFSIWSKHYCKYTDNGDKAFPVNGKWYKTLTINRTLWTACERYKNCGSEDPENPGHYQMESLCYFSAFLDYLATFSKNAEGETVVEYEDIAPESLLQEGCALYGCPENDPAPTADEFQSLQPPCASLSPPTDCKFGARFLFGEEDTSPPETIDEVDLLEDDPAYVPPADCGCNMVHTHVKNVIGENWVKDTGASDETHSVWKDEAYDNSNWVFDDTIANGVAWIVSRLDQFYAELGAEYTRAEEDSDQEEEPPEEDPGWGEEFQNITCSSRSRIELESPPTVQNATCHGKSRFKRKVATQLVEGEYVPIFPVSQYQTPIYIPYGWDDYYWDDEEATWYWLGFTDIGYAQIAPGAEYSDWISIPVPAADFRRCINISPNFPARCSPPE